MLHKRKFPSRLTCHQRVTDENIFRLLRVDFSVADRSALNDCKSEQGDFLCGDHFAAALFPTRGRVAVAAMLAAQLFEPLTFDIGHIAGEQPGRPADFRGDNPGGTSVEEARPGMEHHLAAFGGPVEILFFFTRDACQAAAEDGAVDFVGHQLVNFHL